MDRLLIARDNLEFGKCSKFSNTFFKVGIHKMLLRIVNSKDSDQTATY